MQPQWREWQRRVHRAVLQHLRTPATSGAVPGSAKAPPMPMLSALYGRIVAAKRARALGNAQRLSAARVPVISVGNFTFGATGKTPCVMFLADQILRLTASCQAKESKNRVPMLLTRGYGDDEWRMFAARFPSCKLAVGADRLSLGRQRIAHYGVHQLSCVLLEDGLQQWTIRKDLEIVMVDALAPFGNGKLLPLGSLRELPTDALARADVVLLHHANLLEDATRQQQLVEMIEQLTPQDRKVVVGTSEMAVVSLPTLAEYAARKYDAHDATRTSGWHAFQGKTALVFCGVGNPESVERVVRAMGCWKRVQVESFPDHHAFSESDLRDVKARVTDQQNARDDVVVITTEKDYARSAALTQRVFTAEEGDAIHVHVLVGAFRLQVNGDAVLNRVKNLLDAAK